jgi:hypothetical protein
MKVASRLLLAQQVSATSLTGEARRWCHYNMAPCGSLFDDAVPRERLSLGLSRNVSDGDWLTRYRYTGSKTRHPGVDRTSGTPFRLNDFHFLMMVGIEAGQEVRFARRMSRAWADFHHDWMMWGDLTDGQNVYEAGVRSTWPDTEWVDSDGIQSAEARYLRFCRQYR